MLRDNLRVGTLEGLASSPWVFATVPGNFVLAALLTQYFGIEKELFGLLASLPAWFNAGQILVLPALARSARPKTITVVFATLNFALWALFVAALPWLPRRGAETPAVLVAFFVAASFTWSLTVVGWTAWVQEWVPPRLRGRYFGRRNALIGIATLLFLALSADLLRRGGPEGLAPYLSILTIALSLRLVALVWQLDIRTEERAAAPADPAHPAEGAATGPVPPASRGYAAFGAQIVALFRVPEFRRLVMFGAATGFTINLAAPFTSIFLFEVIEASPAGVNVLFSVSNLAAACAIPVWGRLLDAHGARPVLLAALASWECVNLLWPCVTPGTTWLLPAIYAWNGLMSSGYLLGLFHFLLKILDRRTRTAGASAYAAATAVASALAPVLAGLAIGAATASGADPAPVYRLLFALRSAGSLVALALLAGESEPGASGLRTVLGALQPARIALLVTGAPLFGNALLARGTTLFGRGNALLGRGRGRAGRVERAGRVV